MVNTTNMDLTPSQVVGFIKIKGGSLRELSRINNLAADSLRNALYRHCPKYEKIIADYLDTTPENIWPQRLKSRS